MPENFFDERIAATYEAKWPELFEPAVVDPAVSFLAGLAQFLWTATGPTWMAARWPASVPRQKEQSGPGAARDARAGSMSGWPGR